ncbi:MAG: hypothetical protein RLP02_02285 [Coleofasciculus sp. C2-GNP5-27]
MDWMVKLGKISLMSLAGMILMLTACTSVSNRPEAIVTATNSSPDETISPSVEPSPDSPDNSTPQQNFSSPQTPAANRENYRSIDLSQQADRTSVTGSDPKASPSRRLAIGTLTRIHPRWMFPILNRIRQL